MFAPCPTGGRRGMPAEYKAVDFPSGVIGKVGNAEGVNRILAQNPGWDPVLFVDGPHMAGPVLILGRGSGVAAAAGLHARKVPKVEAEFVCSDCGGDITVQDKVCPHCGAPIEDG